MLPEIGPIKTFGIMFALGFVAAGGIIARRLREQGKPVDWAYEIIFSGLLGGLVGSRAYYLIQHPSEFGLSGIFGGSGLVWYGGAIGGAVGVLLWAWRRDLLGLGLLDLCAVPLAMGYAIGRIGCQVSGDGDYGKASSLPWAMAYPKGTVPTTEKVQPTPIYETLAMALLAWVLWRLRDRVRPGVLFALYLVGAGAERFVVEFARRNHEALAGLTGPQLESVALFAAGVVWMIAVSLRRGGLQTAQPAA